MIEQSIYLTVNIDSKNLKKIREVLCKNNYPTHFYDPVIKMRIHDIYKITPVILKKIQVNTLTYIPLLHNQVINRKITICINHINIKVADKINNQTGKLFIELD